MNCCEILEILLGTKLIDDNPENNTLKRYAIHFAIREGLVKNIQVLLNFYGATVQERVRIMYKICCDYCNCLSVISMVGMNCI